MGEVVSDAAACGCIPLDEHGFDAQSGEDLTRVAGQLLGGRFRSSFIFVLVRSAGPLLTF